MSYYHTIHFHARLGKDTPSAVLDTLEAQFTTDEEWATAGRLGLQHPFFTVKKADRIPHATNQEDYDPPLFRRHPAGGAYLRFSCQVNHGYSAILAFVDWLAPYVVREGKRLRGRTTLGVGSCAGEERYPTHVHVLTVPYNKRPAIRE